MAQPAAPACQPGKAWSQCACYTDKMCSYIAMPDQVCGQQVASMDRHSLRDDAVKDTDDKLEDLMAQLDALSH